MYFISILAVILVAVLAGCYGGIPTGLHIFLDLPSLFLLLLICIPILIVSGLLKDFSNAFRISLSKKKSSSLIEIKRAIEAVSLMFRTLISSGLFLFLISIITMFTHLDEPEWIGPNIAVAALCLLYGIGLAILLLPIKSILEVRIIEFMAEQKEETAGTTETEEITETTETTETE